MSVAKVASVANADGEALTSFDGGGEDLAADRGLDHVFDVSDVDAVTGSGGAVDVHLEIRCASNAFGIEIAGAWDGTQDALNLFGLLLDDLEVGPKTLTPTWVRMPVESMSMRLRMGCVQMLVTPGIRSLSSRRARMESLVVPWGHSSLGLKTTVVSAMLIGAGSVEVSARPTLPTTMATAGSARRMRSCWRRISVALVREIRGSVMGMKSAVSSLRGGMNSEPMVVAV